MNLKLTSFFLFLGFIAITLLVKFHIFESFDYASIVWIQRLIPKQFDPWLSTLSLVGSFEVLTGLLIILIFWKKKKAFLPILSLFFIGHAIEIAGKYFLYHPGPPHQFFRYTIPFFFPTSGVQPGSAYPSGHAYRSVFITIIIMFIISHARSLSKNMKTGLFILLSLILVIILVSRTSLGEHWSSDVIGGTLLGGSFSLLSLLFL